MKLLPLVWANLMRRKIRTFFTLFAIVASFFVWGIVGAFEAALSAGVDVAGADRLVAIHKVSLIMPLPESYGPRIAQVPGVAAVTHASWFGGIYQDPKNFFPQLAVETETYLDLYPEYRLPDDQRKAWLANRTGALVGRTTADRFGFKVGDRIPIQGTFNVKKDGSRLWEFTVDGIYDAGKGVDTSALLFHYDYLDEARAGFQGNVGWYVLKVADPAQAERAVKAIDALFANSPAETKTSTEKAFAQSFADQVGNIGAIAVAISAIVFFAMLLVAGNTMAQAVRERTRELAVLKTLGFKDGRVLGLVIAESTFLAALGGAIGLGLAWLFIQGGDPTGGLLPVFFLPGRKVVLGAAVVAALGLVTGILPGWQATRLSIVDALRRGA